MSGGEPGGDAGREAGWQARAGAPTGASRIPQSRRGKPRSATALLDEIFPEAVPAAAAGDEGVLDLQQLLTGAVRRLAQQCAATHSAAWDLREDGRVQVWAAHHREGDPVRPQPGDQAFLRALTRATDLGAKGLDGRLSVFAARTGFAAAAPIVAGTTEPGHAGAERAGAAIVLLVGGCDDGPGRVRPRTLAILEEIAAGLRPLLSTAAAAERLGALDGVVQRLDRLSSLGELLAEIAHEIRNPLVSMKTFLQLLPDRGDDPEFVVGFRGVVLEEVRRLERLLDTVLRHARPNRSEGPGSGADVLEAFQAVEHLLLHRARERGVELVCHADSEDPRVEMHPDALRQVMLNLTLNAIEASPAGAHVELDARVRRDAAGSWVEIAVDDAGDGIEEAERERIFEAFHRGRSGGARLAAALDREGAERPGGLGLAISRRLVQEAGGELRVGVSQAGGARFSFRLPASTRSR